MRRFALPIMAGIAVFGVAACSPDEQDFAEEAEKYIGGDEVEDETGVAFSDVECQEPASKDVGTTYTCTAVDEASGTPWDFTVEITGDRELTVQSGNPSGDATTTGTDVATDGTDAMVTDTTAAA